MKHKTDKNVQEKRNLIMDERMQVGERRVSVYACDLTAEGDDVAGEKSLVAFCDTQDEE